MGEGINNVNWIREYPSRKWFAKTCCFLAYKHYAHVNIISTSYTHHITSNCIGLDNSSSCVVEIQLSKQLQGACLARIPERSRAQRWHEVRPRSKQPRPADAAVPVTVNNKISGSPGTSNSVAYLLTLRLGAWCFLLGFDIHWELKVSHCVKINRYPQVSLCWGLIFVVHLGCFDTTDCL